MAQAEDILRDYLRQDPGNVGAWRSLARIRADRNDPDEAQALLEAGAAAGARLRRRPLRLRHDAAAAAEARSGATGGRAPCWRGDPANRDYLKQYSAACVALGDHEAVVDLYARLLADQPPFGDEVADLRLWRANALKVVGRQSEAIVDHRASPVARPDNGVAWFSLANLKTYRFSDDDVTRLRWRWPGQVFRTWTGSIWRSPWARPWRTWGEYEASWRHYALGNATRRALAAGASRSRRPAPGRLKSAFTAEVFTQRAGLGADDPAPIFILGLPRSGSTLFEQILASHSRVEGTQELTQIGRYAGELCGLDPDCDLPLIPRRCCG
ncbi:sulfotransferase [Caulobacter segnis]